MLALAYHALSERWPAPLSVTPGAFERQIGLLLSRGYRPTTFSDANGSGQRKSLAITFDDSFRSVHELAFPILRRLGAVATVFVPTAYVGAERMAWPGTDRWLETPHASELAAMDWPQLRELRDAGWEIGSHTHTHPMLTEVSPSRLADELGRSKTAVAEELGSCESLAYPYGDHDSRVVAAARAAGYRFGATLPKRLSRDDPMRSPRVGAYHGDDLLRFRLKVSPALRVLRSTRVWPALSRVGGAAAAPRPPL